VGCFRGVERDGQCYYSDRLDSFAAEAIEVLHLFLELLFVIAYFFKGRQKKYFYLAVVVNDDF
jgi:hypothetical protein